MPEYELTHGVYYGFILVLIITHSVKKEPAKWEL